MGISSPTVKRLFALSRNECAFPECKEPLIKENVVIGEICHIKGRKPDAKRYDASQTPEQRDAFENLVLMCRPHHKIIDTDEKSYTVQRLTEIKAEHEKAGGSGLSLSDDLVKVLISANENAVAHNGSNIVSINQHGGQIAHSITNIGAQPRRIDAAAATAFVEALKPYAAGENVEVRAMMGNSESKALAVQIADILTRAGWKVAPTDALQTMGGVVVFTKAQRKEIETLIIGLRKVGLLAAGAVDAKLSGLPSNPNPTAIIVVGDNSGRLG